LEKYIVGIDVGTSAVKVGVFNCYGEIAAYEKKEYPTESPKSNYAEQNPELWWSAVNNCIIKIFKKNKIPPNFVKAIGVTGQTRTQVFVNYKGEPLRPAIIWQDRRSFNEAKWINRKFSKKDIIHYLGYQPPIDFSFPSARLLWVKNHECRIFEKTYKVLQPKDYINYKLTSNLSSDISSSFGLINI